MATRKRPTQRHIDAEFKRTGDFPKFSQQVFNRRLGPQLRTVAAGRAKRQGGKSLGIGERIRIAAASAQVNLGNVGKGLASANRRIRTRRGTK